MSLEGKQLGHYRLLRLLGSGGMGEVYLGEDPRIAQQVAIKVIRSEVTPYPGSRSAQEAARLFEREAKAVSRLDHPNILPLYAYGEEMIDGQHLSYLVMPYRKEGTLADWLHHRGTAELLSPQDVAHLITQAAEALQHAHDQQVLHQDIKPSNFLIRSRHDRPHQPDLLLADFGIAKFTGASANVSQSIRGTPGYMAPEQWEGHPVPATDQYALAVMAYELLTGRQPFQGSISQLMYQHFQAVPHPPSTLNPRLSAAIDRVLLQALSKKPDERFASVAAFASAFQQAVTSLSQYGPAGLPPSLYGPPFPAMGSGTGSQLPASGQHESTLRPSNPSITVPNAPQNLQEATTLASHVHASTPVNVATGRGHDQIISPRKGLSRGNVVVLVTALLLVVLGSAALLTIVGTRGIFNTTTPAPLATQANAPAQASVQDTPPAQAIATATPSPVPSPPPESILGTWHSDFGPVTFEGSDQHITGFWIQAPDKRGIIESGTFDPSTGKLMFSYYQNWNNQHGVANLTLSADGKRLAGTWNQGNGSGTWIMTRS